MSAEIPARVAERAATRYTVVGECWLSTYATINTGYSSLGFQAGGKHRDVLAHRAAFVYHAGRQIADGQTVDHTCFQKRCVNPEHLRELELFENARRTYGRNWPLGECVNGHPNDHLSGPPGQRECSICRRESSRRRSARYRDRKKARA